MPELSTLYENDFVYCSKCGNILYGRTQPCYVCGGQMRTILTAARIWAAKIYITLTIIAFVTFISLGLFLSGIFIGIINAFVGVSSIVLLYHLKQNLADMYITKILVKLSKNLNSIPLEAFADIKTGSNKVI